MKAGLARRMAAAISMGEVGSCARRARHSTAQVSKAVGSAKRSGGNPTHAMRPHEWGTRFGGAPGGIGFVCEAAEGQGEVGVVGGHAGEQVLR